ncbi:hypothetical protein HO133_006009 [Letharia lupina]|uniref:Fe2OG dioxygenase domain-containing protein n=1 Tax=Letharia lupina TaxID=560253 RepID=A0A8H6F8H7_9LECA|nr:uncharacterized protein HO133_006009 [Letharia lupina]KAF6218658.1 hypothetical protein HO133_006009 [Letharia lupina]
MVSQRLFDALPPFPKDVSTADVPKFSLSRLFSGDSVYAHEVFETCRTTGFFLLEMGGEEIGDNMISEVDAMFDISNNVFDLEIEEKTRYAQDASKGKFTGWKDIGIMKTDTGAPDRCEFYALAQDDIIGNMSSLPHPDAIESHRSTIESFLRHAHSILTQILSILDAGLGLQRGTLASLVSQERSSGTLVRMIRYPPQPLSNRRTSLLRHTDMGAITFLCSIVGGLQILTPGSDPTDEAAWRYIRPAPNCAIINIGDALVEWSGGILRSNMHRVTYAPGAQADFPRHSIAYLVRGNKSVSMKRLQSERIPSAAEDGEVEMDVSCEEWELNKNKALTAGADCARSRGGRDLVPAVKCS